MGQEHLARSSTSGFRGGHYLDWGLSVQRTGAAAFTVIPRSIDYIRTGKLRALAVTSAAHLEVLPNVPTVDEFVPGYEASSWFGFGAPKGTSTEIIEKLNKEIDAIVAEPNMKARLVGLGLQPMSLTSAEFGKFIADQIDKWAKVIRAANIKPE